MDGRIPAHLEVSGLIRAVEAQGGFATVLARGERDAGTILVVCCEHGTQGRIYERMPTLEGTREWTLVKRQDNENPSEFPEYLERRHHQDTDSWIVELDIANAERFIGF
ncbi:MAG TPA: DUF1491 family protein [Alteraurantiacibacter sp.]|jgi:hypothetical protein